MLLSKSSKLLENFFWIYLFINPLLDIFTGLYYNVILGLNTYLARTSTDLGTSPSLITRLIVLIFFAIYIMIQGEKKDILLFLPIGIAFIMSLLSEYITYGTINLMVDIQYIVKFSYNVAVIIVYSHLFHNQWIYKEIHISNRLQTMFNITAIGVSLSILIPAMLKTGFTTYADKYGFRGYCGYFFAGNDVTAIFVLLFPITIGYALNNNEKRKSHIYLISSGLTANTLLIIGSKTAFLACCISYAFFLVLSIVDIITNRTLLTLKKFIALILVFLLIFSLLTVLSGGNYLKTIAESYGITKVVNENEGIEVAMFSGRAAKLRVIFDRFKNGGPLIWFFGLSRGGQENTLEMDIFEVLFYYGIFGFISMLWIYIYLAIDFLKNIFSKFNIYTFAAFIAIGTVLGFMTLAGHVLFTVTSGFYLSIVIVYSRVLFSDTKNDILLWKRS